DRRLPAGRPIRARRAVPRLQAATVKAYIAIQSSGILPEGHFLMCCWRIQIATLIFVLVLASHAIAGCTRAPSNGTPAQIVIERIESGYLFREGSDSVLVYRHEVVRPGHVHARSHYVHPLYSLSGAGLTVD